LVANPHEKSLPMLTSAQITVGAADTVKVIVIDRGVFDAAGAATDTDAV
jgi:hypothetical protein